MTDRDDFDVRLRTHPDGTVVVSVTGDLDMATAPRLEDEVASIDRHARLVIDLSGCTFLDSAAIRLLATLARDAEAAGGSASLVLDDAGLLRVLTITAVDTILDIHPTIDAALAQP